MRFSSFETANPSKLVSMKHFEHMFTFLGLHHAAEKLDTYKYERRKREASHRYTMPLHAVADIFFYNELCSSIGHVRAQHWLATASSRNPSRPVSHDPTCEDDTFGKKSREHIARLMNDHDDKVGVFFTDAAHELLGSPRSVASNCSSRSQPGLPTIADFFFYNELRSTLGHVHAEQWLATAAPPCIRSRPASQARSIEPKNRRSASSPRVRSALGHVEKENWLAMASPTSSPSRPASQEISGEANKRRSRQDDECDLARLMKEHGDKVGLLFTDAAHELLDSPRSMTSTSSGE